MKLKRSLSKNAANFVVLATCLICGVVIGAISASYISGETASSLIEYISDSAFIDALNFSDLLPIIIFNVYKYPIFLFLFGFTFLGIFLVPLVLLLKGFFLSFSISAIIVLYGVQGVIVSLAVFGIQTLLLIPCMLMISNQSINAARAQWNIVIGTKKAVSPVLSKKFFAIFGMAVCILLFLVVLEIYVTPKIADSILYKLL